MKRKPTAKKGNNATQGEKDLLQVVLTDTVFLKASNDAMLAGNRMSEEFTSFLENKHLDSGNARTLKCKKTLDKIDDPGFVGEDLTSEIVDYFNPELRPLIRWCKHSGTEMDFFVQTYLGALRKASSNAKSGMDFHRDKLTEWVHGREPDVRVCFQRIADSDPDKIEKELAFRRLVQGTADRFDKISFQIPDGGIVLLGPVSSGKISSIQHQPSIYHSKNSFSIMVDLTFPDGSQMKQWTVPEIAAYFKKLGIFEDEPSLNIRYGERRY